MEAPVSKDWREVSLPTGERVYVFARNDAITLLPDLPLSALRGFLKGMDIEGAREKKRIVFERK